MMVVTSCKFGCDLTRLWLMHLTDMTGQLKADIRLVACMNGCIQFQPMECTYFVALTMLGNERRTVHHHSDSKWQRLTTRCGFSLEIAPPLDPQTYTDWIM